MASWELGRTQAMTCSTLKNQVRGAQQHALYRRGVESMTSEWGNASLGVHRSSHSIRLSHTQEVSWSAEMPPRLGRVYACTCLYSAVLRQAMTYSPLKNQVQGGLAAGNVPYLLGRSWD